MTIYDTSLMLVPLISIPSALSRIVWAATTSTTARVYMDLIAYPGPKSCFLKLGELASGAV